MRQLVAYFFRLGSIGFGGPAALVATMEDDLVERRRWLNREEYLEGLAICQTLPGPLANQVGIYVGYVRRGVVGAWMPERLSAGRRRFAATLAHGTRLHGGCRVRHDQPGARCDHRDLRRLR